MKKKEQNRRICDYDQRLQGLATNRFGGSRLQRIEGLRGSTYGAANEGRSYSRKEILDESLEILKKYGYLA